MRRIMVDMSATLIHHGHIRLLHTASKLGSVIVALTTDEEVVKKKGYQPELNFDARREILESIKYVSEVVPSPWLISTDFLNAHKVDVLLHGDDNSNDIPAHRLLVIPRTEGVSSTDIREKCYQIVKRLKS